MTTAAELTGEKSQAGSGARNVGAPFAVPPIDCDIHPAGPSIRALLPYVEDVWRELIVLRGIDRLALNLTSYPADAPATVRPDWRVPGGRPGSDLALLKAQALDAFGSQIAICNVLHGAQLLHSEDMCAVFCTALNTWIARELLDRDPRLRASILIPPENPELAVEEIERCAPDWRFVQVLLYVMGERPLGKRCFWPIYEAAVKHGLPIGVHAGSGYRHPPTSTGWPSYFMEDYVAQSAAFETQLLSFVAEGAFARFPDLKVVFIESGFTWLPAFMWRLGKTWRGVRAEVPWVKQAPPDVIRHHLRLTLQPVDPPVDPLALERIIDQLGTEDMLLFSTDYPHAHFAGTNALPRALAGAHAAKVLADNALATYARLRPQPAGEEVL
ncbi:MAG: amidohydrolase [Hyphomicrobiaceae bacterium]|nr:amidohydrolase [Hyphomicrobiaceae bacterium]